MKAPNSRQAIIELTLAAAIWGYGFIATKYALEGFDPLTLNSLRFGISCLVILPLVGLVPMFKTRRHWELFKLSIVPGILLSLLMYFQTRGLVYTSATKSGFITTLYIVIVPMCEFFFLRKRLQRSHLFWVLIALIGTAMICDFQGGDWNLGDGLTFLCAIAAALHIIAIAKISHRVDSPMAFNGYQSVISFLLSTLLIYLTQPMGFDPPPHFSINSEGLWLSPAGLGILYLALASTTIAFMLQIRAQQVLSASSASLIFLLESPFAAIFGFLLLNEWLSIHQWLGALLILIAARKAV